MKYLILLLLSCTIAFSQKKITNIPDSVKVYTKYIHEKYGLPVQPIIAISVLETGWWRSFGFRTKKNCFGIYNYKNENRKFKSYKDNFEYFAYLITTKKVYKSAYKHRDNNIKFVEGLKSWSILKGEYIKKLKVILRKYRFIC